MPQVEVFESDETNPLFVSEFDFLPRSGEYVSKEADGYFRYYNVVEVWYREDTPTGVFRACIRVTLDD